MPLNRAALSAIVQYRLSQRAAQEAQAKEERDFNRKLELAGIGIGLRTGQIVPDFQGNQFRGYTTPTNLAQRQLESTLPQTPFTPGPSGSFITSQQPLIEGQNFLPGAMTPRSQVVQQMAPQLVNRMRIESQMQPVFSEQNNQLTQIGQVPKGSRILRSGIGNFDYQGDFGQDTTQPSGLPDPSRYQEGTLIEDDAGNRYRRIRGQWVVQ